MGCCGSRRQQLSSSLSRRFLEQQGPSAQPAAGWGAAPTRPAPPAPQPGSSPDGAAGDDPMSLVYLGAAALALRSPLTGREYRLEPGAPFWVLRQDGDLLLATGLCLPA
jgi:hypothetical protein